MGIYSKTVFCDSKPWLALSTYPSTRFCCLIFAYDHAVECQIRQVGNLGSGLYYNAKRGPGGSCLHCRSQCWFASQLHSYSCCHWHHYGAVSWLHSVLDVSSFRQICCTAASSLSLTLNVVLHVCADTYPCSPCLTALQSCQDTGPISCLNAVHPLTTRVCEQRVCCAGARRSLTLLGSCTA